MTGTVLFTVRCIRAVQVFQIIGIIIISLTSLGSIALLATLLLAVAESLGAILLVITAAALALALAGALLLSMWRSIRLAMVITTDGIAVRGHVRDHWIPWAEVAVIETSDHWYWVRATRIVTTSGRRVDPAVTAYQFLWARGESYDAVTRDPRIPQLSTRIAIDAHRRYLRGEFGAV